MPSSKVKISAKRKRANIQKRSSGKSFSKFDENQIPCLIDKLKSCHSQFSIQNKKFRSFHDKFEESLNYYFRIYDFPGAFLNIDNKGIINELNHGACELFENNYKVMKNTDLSQYVAITSKSKFFTFLQSCFLDQKKQTCDLFMKKSDGKEFFAYVEAIHIKDKYPDVHSVSLSVIDISCFSNFEDQFLRNKNDLNLVEKAIKSGIWRFDLRNNEISFSDESYRLFGFKKSSQLSYDELLLRVHPDDRKIVDKKWKRALIAKTFDIEHRIVVDKNVKWLREKAFFESDSKGKVFAGFGITQDITEHKSDQEYIANQKEQLEIIIDSSPTFIFFKDKENNFIRVNKAFSKFMGIPKNKLEGGKLYDFVPKEQADDIWKEDLDVISTGKAKLNLFEYFSVKNKIRCLRIDKIPYKDRKGNIIGVIGFGFDVTEHKMAEQEILKMASFPILNPQPIVEASPDGTIYFMNPSAVNLFPNLRRKGIKHPFLNDWSTVIKKCCNDNSYIYTREQQVGDKWFLQSMFCIKEPIRIRIYTLDITQSKRSQESLQKILHKAVDLEKIINMAPIMVYRCKMQKGWPVLYVSQNVSGLGYLSEEFTSGKISWQNIIHPKDLTFIKKNILTYVEKGIDEFSQEYRLVAKNKDVRAVHEITRVVRDKKNGVLYLQGLISDITERKRIENALSENRKILQGFYDTSSYLMAIIELQEEQFIIVDGNISMAKFFGFDTNHICGKTIKDLGIDEKTNALWINHFKNCKKKGKPVKFEHEYLNTSSQHWLRLTIAFLGEKGPNQPYFSFIAEDITKHKHSQLIIKNDMEKFEFMAMVSSELLHCAEPEIVVNSVCKKVMEYLKCDIFFNYLSDEKLNKLHLYAYSGISKENFNEIEWLDYSDAICGCAGRDKKIVVIDDIQKNNEERVKFVKSLGIKAFACYPLIVLNDKAIGTLAFGTKTFEKFKPQDLSLIKFISDQVAVAMIRINSEVELRKSRDDLEKRVWERTTELTTERKRLYDVLDTLPVYVVLLSEDHCIYFANKTFINRFGSIEQNKRCYEHLFKRNNPCENCESFKVLKTNNHHNREWEAPDGHFYEVYDFPFKENEKTFVMEMGIDVTDRKTAEEDLIKAIDILADTKRLSDIGALATTVAHELRNPLAAIKIATYNIKRKSQDPSLMTHLKNIDTKVGEGEQIISNLLFYSKIKMPMVENVNIHTLISNCVDETGAHFAKKNVFIEQNLIGINDLLIKVDPVQMREVFTNVLNNAFDAIDEKTGKIYVSANVEGKCIRIIIKDNGEGIEEEDINRVFESFFTTKAKGTGLGLSICRQILRLHNGQIEIESKKGSWTQVTIILPMKKD